MAVTVAQRRSLSLAQAKRKRADILATGERMRARDAPVGTLPTDLRIRRGFEDIGMPDTSAAQGPAQGYRTAEANTMLAQEQDISPLSQGAQLGEAVQSDAGYGFYDEAGTFQLANERDHVILQDPQTGRLSVLPRDPSMEQGAPMGLARTLLGGMAAGAPSRVPGGAAAITSRAPSAAATTVQAFDRAGVDPSLVTALQNRATSVAANMLRNTPAGGPIERGVRGNIEQAGQGVEQLAASLTDVGEAATAGARVRAGAGEFIKATVPRRQEELYGKAEELIGSGGRTAMPRTLQVLDEMEAEISDPAIRAFITDPNVSGLAQTIRAASPRGVSFSDIRQFRTDIRGLKSSQDSKVGLNKTKINRIYNAMTRDMEGMALASGGDEALNAIRKADLFTYRMMGEGADLQTTSAPVRVLRELVDGRSDEQIYSTMRQWSGRGSGADVSKLDLVKRAVQKTDNKQAWNDFTGAFLRNMGKVKPGAATAADVEEWSPSTFLTNYESMAPRARSIMFGDNPSLRSALDDYLTVAASLKNVQKLGNPSGSGAHAVMAGTAGTIATAIFTGNVPLLATALGALGTGNVAARIMMNPRAIRWITRAARISKDAQSQPRARADMSWRGHLKALSALGSNDAEIVAPLTKLIEELRASAHGEQASDSTSTAARQ